MQRILKTIIILYRYFISPLIAPSCRFYPTCSAYGLEAIERRGAVYGEVLTVKRILKCHPFNAGGYDPLPLLSSLPKEAKTGTHKNSFQEAVKP